MKPKAHNAAEKEEESTAMDENESEWELPTEAEMKVILAKRERSDKISSLMGEYLLKGYKMLSSMCDVCDTILMQDKHGTLYCVACAEIDCTESAKDDPTLNEAAARRQALESQFHANSAASSCDDSDSVVGKFGLPTTGTTQSTPSMSKNKSLGPLTTSSSTSRTCLTSLTDPVGSSAAEAPDHNYNTSIKSNEDAHMYDVVLGTPDTSDDKGQTGLTSQEQILREKIDWACRLIKHSKNAQRCIDLSNLVKSCAESIAAIQAISNKRNS